jgi:hypothetical protein
MRLMSERPVQTTVRISAAVAVIARGRPYWLTLAGAGRRRAQVATKLDRRGRRRSPPTWGRGRADRHQTQDLRSPSGTTIDERFAAFQGLDRRLGGALVDRYRPRSPPGVCVAASPGSMMPPPALELRELHKRSPPMYRFLQTPRRPRGADHGHIRGEAINISFGAARTAGRDDEGRH